MSYALCLTVFLAAVVPLLGCSSDLTVPEEPGGANSSSFDASLSPSRNLEIILQSSGAGSGFGLVKFRQPKDDEAIVNLDVWVRGLSPNTSYQLQRATDPAVDDVCVGTNWLTLGQGLVPRSIMTDDQGTGREALFRDLSAVAPGSAFDIYFRVIDGTGAVVLQSECYQFVVSL
jgi:hypothetical protein